jgi:hypothetical protein
MPLTTGTLFLNNPATAGTSSIAHELDSGHTGSQSLVDAVGEANIQTELAFGSLPKGMRDFAGYDNPTD